MLLAFQVTVVVVAVVLIAGAIIYLIDKTLDR
jgi:preprotein translocase subunit SecE